MAIIGNNYFYKEDEQGMIAEMVWIWLLPCIVMDPSIGRYGQQLINHCHFMELWTFRILKIRVWDPYLIQHGVTKRQCLIPVVT